MELMQRGGLKHYPNKDPVLGLLDVIIRDLGLPADTKFQEQLMDRRNRQGSSAVLRACLFQAAVAASWRYILNFDAPMPTSIHLPETLSC